jgi:hypothetical protein
MKVYEDIDAQEFRDKAWSGAADTLEDLTDDQIETIFQYLEDTEGEEGMSLTALNDFFWFERDTIADWLGYSDYEQLMKRGEKGNEFYDDTDIGIRLTHGTQGINDEYSIDDLLSDAKDDSDGDYWISDDAEEDWDDDTERYVGSVMVDVSEAILEWLDENGVTYERLS